jgi:predicted membrane metal-binding protein
MRGIPYYLMQQPLKIPTDRSFGFTFAVVFALVGAWLLWRGSRWGVPVLGVGGAFALIAVSIPGLLHPFNVVWMKFGFLLGKVVTPIVMGLIFFLMFAPVGLYFRMIRRDALLRSFERDKTSYWIERTPPGPDGKTLPRQF